MLFLALALQSVVSCGDAPKQVTVASQKTAPVAKDPAPVTSSDVVTALTHSSAEGFAGELTFIKENWCADPDGQPKYTQQLWRIHTDSKAQVRTEVSLPQAKSQAGHIAGESRSRRWIFLRNHSELVVLDKLDAPDVSKELEARVSLMDSILRQAHGEIRWLLGSQIAASDSLRIVLLDRYAAQPSAVVEVQGETRYFRFNRIGSDLLVSYSLSSAGGTTFEWTYSDYRKVGEKWIPGTAELRQTNVQGELDRWLYTAIATREIRTVEELRQSFRVPSPEEPEFASTTAVTTLSGRFRDKPIETEGRPSFSRLSQLRLAEREGR